MLVVPYAHDQPDNADRLHRLGVARVVPAKKYRAERVAGELKELLESFQANEKCHEVKVRFSGVDAIGKTCELIEELDRG